MAGGIGIGSGSGGTTGDEAIGVGETVTSGVCVGDGDGAELGLAEDVGSGEGLFVGITSKVGVGVAAGELVASGDSVADALGDGSSVLCADAVGVGDDDASAMGDGVAVVTEGEGVALAPLVGLFETNSGHAP